MSCKLIQFRLFANIYKYPIIVPVAKCPRWAVEGVIKSQSSAVDRKGGVEGGGSDGHKIIE